MGKKIGENFDKDIFQFLKNGSFLLGTILLTKFYEKFL